MFKHKSSSVEPWMKTNEVEHAPIYKINYIVDVSLEVCRVDGSQNLECGPHIPGVSRCKVLPI
jgi:hypothetical protein